MTSPAMFKTILVANGGSDRAFKASPGDEGRSFRSVLPLMKRSKLFSELFQQFSPFPFGLHSPNKRKLGCPALGFLPLLFLFHLPFFIVKQRPKRLC